MTNGEKIKEIFPNAEYLECEVVMDVVFARNQENWFDLEWWNAEYKEPTIENDCAEQNGCITCSLDDGDDCCRKLYEESMQEPATKNDLALIHTEGLDEEIRCTMCTNSMKSDRGCDGSCVVNKDMYKAVMDAIEKRIQPTSKSDLGVDCIDRAELLKAMDTWDKFGYLAHVGLIRLGKENKYYVQYVRYEDMVNCVKGMLSVTPQPRKGCLSIDDVMSVFDDFMCGEVDEDGTETFLEMLKDKADMREVENDTD